MKSLLVLLSFFFLLPHTFNSFTFFAEVSDSRTGEKIEGAEVEVTKRGKLVARGLSDKEGKIRLWVEKGVYEVQIRKEGYTQTQILDLDFVPDTRDYFFFKMNKADLDLDQVEVRSFRLIDATSRAKLKAGSSSGIGASPKDEKAVASGALEDRSITIRGSREIEAFSMDAAEPAPPTVEMIESYSDDVLLEEAAGVELDGIKVSSFTEPSSTPLAAKRTAPRQKAGQLTAGEWKDSDNWTFWKELMADVNFKSTQDHWQFYPNHRYQVHLVDEREKVLVDVPVSLLDEKGKVVWESRTDNKGQAELWAGLYDPKLGTGKYQIKVNHPMVEQVFDAQPYNKRMNYYKIPVNCYMNEVVDIALVVDATGSMGDEISYIQAELGDMVERVYKDHRDLAINVGSVFYRDRRDAYVTKMANFSPNINTTIEFINRQFAGGGGDYPEAVHTALDLAVQEMNWSQQAISRLLFLVLDAPPHHQTEVIDRLKASIQAAARKGIKVIPIAASGVNKQTEFLLKFFALSTNGTYVFLTDHSGIGNTHLKPTAGEYNIETLNDLMVRLILENVEVDDCEQIEDPNQAIPEPNPQAINFIDQVTGLDFQLQYYPNPATNYFFVELEKDLDEFWILDAAGQELHHQGQMPAGQHRIDLVDYPSGTYVLRFRSGEKTIAKQLVVVRPD
ncbi:MAG: T9SS type A sorting domain-containing protein [Bacteroidota bacterium]